MKQIYQFLSLIALFLCLQPELMFSQYVSFGYDAAGNRIKREIILETHNNDLKKAPKKAFVSETLSDKTIKIYPNPTKGILKIEIVGWTETDTGSVAMFNAGGTRLLSTPLTESTLTLDITGYTSGLYLMHIKLGENETTWKIIRE